MGDPLTLLRQYNVGSREIIERDNQIIFGEFSWPKNVQTKFRCKLKDSTEEYFYTLESLLYFLKNYHIPHPDYVRQAKDANIQPVLRPDRGNMLKYLYGEIDTCASIESGPLEKLTQGKRRHDHQGGESAPKKSRVEGNQNVKKNKRKRKKKGKKPQ